MNVTKKLKYATAYLMAVVLVITGMTGYRARAEENEAESITWQCMDGSYWVSFGTFGKHTDNASTRTQNSVSYYIAEKSDDTLQDLILSPSTDLIMNMSNGEGETPFLEAGESVEVYIATGMISADEFTTEDLAKTSAITVSDANKLAYNQSQNDKRKILTNEYTSMKLVNGSKYMVIWFRTGAPAAHFEGISTWTKLCSYNGNSIYYNVSLNGNEGYAGISSDETNIYIAANSSATTYRRARFYNVDGTSESLPSDGYSNKTYALSLEKLSQEGCNSFYMAAQGTKSYGIGIDFKVVSEETDTTEEVTTEEVTEEPTTEEETTTEEVTEEPTTEEETTTEEVTEEPTTGEEDTTEEPTTEEVTAADKNYIFKDNGTVMPEVLDCCKPLSEQMPAELSLTAVDEESVETEVTVPVTEWRVDTESMVLGHYAVPTATFTFEGKTYEFVGTSLLVSSSQLKYFVDCNSGSEVEFPAISSNTELVNGTTADQAFDSNVEKTWGYVDKGRTKSLTTYENGLYNTGYYASNANASITYKFWVENGTYKFTSGHCEWWGGGNKRSVKVTVSYEDKDHQTYSKEMGISEGTTVQGEQPAVSNYFTVSNTDEGAYVTVRFSKASGQEAAVAYMGIEKSLIELPKAPEGLQWAGNEELPYHFAWAATEGADFYNFYINGEKIGTTVTPAFDADAALFEKPGDYNISVTAENIAGESEAAKIIYTVIDDTTTTVDDTTTTVDETTEAPKPTESETPKPTDPEETTKEAVPTGGNEAVVTTTDKAVTPATKAPQKVKVGKTKVTTAVKKKKSSKIKISLKRIKGAKKYQIQISTTRKFKKKIVRRIVKKAKVTISNKKLKNKRKLYVRARAIKIVDKKKYYGSWSKVKKVKTK